MSLDAPATSGPAHMQFDDNRLLPLLFGEHDQNLARIEQELGVSPGLARQPDRDLRPGRGGRDRASGSDAGSISG